MHAGVCLTHDGSVFDNRETTRVVMRSLTARAVMKVLVQLEGPDPFTFTWLQRYCAGNPPIKGEEVCASKA